MLSYVICNVDDVLYLVTCQNSFTTHLEKINIHTSFNIHSSICIYACINSKTFTKQREIDQILSGFSIHKLINTKRIFTNRVDHTSSCHKKDQLDIDFCLGVVAQCIYMYILGLNAIYIHVHVHVSKKDLLGKVLTVWRQAHIILIQA